MALLTRAFGPAIVAAIWPQSGICVEFAEHNANIDHEIVISQCNMDLCVAQRELLQRSMCNNRAIVRCSMEHDNVIVAFGIPTEIGTDFAIAGLGLMALMALMALWPSSPSWTRMDYAFGVDFTISVCVFIDRFANSEAISGRGRSGYKAIRDIRAISRPWLWA